MSVAHLNCSIYYYESKTDDQEQVKRGSRLTHSIEYCIGIGVITAHNCISFLISAGFNFSLFAAGCFIGLFLRTGFLVFDLIQLVDTKYVVPPVNVLVAPYC